VNPTAGIIARRADVTTEELIEMARGAVADEYASDEDVAAYLEMQGMIGRNLPSPN
jgi:hypothetical protein